MLRTFVGLKVPPSMVPELLGLQRQIPVGRAVPEENLHLTLAFLGDVSEEKVEELHLELDGASLSGCEIATTGLVLMGGSSAKVLAVEVTLAPELSALQGRVARAVRAAGLAPARERFRPHITLVRFGSGLRGGEQVRLGRAMQEIVGASGFSARAKAAALTVSTLTSNGPLYEDVAVYLLRG